MDKTTSLEVLVFVSEGAEVTRVPSGNSISHYGPACNRPFFIHPFANLFPLEAGRLEESFEDTSLAKNTTEGVPIQE